MNRAIFLFLILFAYTPVGLAASWPCVPFHRDPDKGWQRGKIEIDPQSLKVGSVSLSGVGLSAELRCGPKYRCDGSVNRQYPVALWNWSQGNSTVFLYLAMTEQKDGKGKVTSRTPSASFRCEQP